MAKILYFNVPASGHTGPSLPIASELVRRGHQVSFYCTADFRPQIEQTGSTYVGYPAGIAEARLHTLVVDVPLLMRRLMEHSPELTTFCIEEIEREKPDLVMFDAMTLWAWIAAKVTGTPTAVTLAAFAPGAKADVGFGDLRRVLPSLLRNYPGIRRARKRLSRIYPDVEFPGAPIPAIGDTNIRFTTPEGQPPGATTSGVVLVGPSVVDADPTSVIEWLPDRGTLPLVYVSLGTIHNQNLAFYRELFTAFGEYPAQFVMPVGRDTDLSPLGPVPENFVVRDYVPQSQVLSRASAFITHGGMNSAQEGLHFGVPEVGVPQTLEQVVNTRQVANLGAGLVLGDRAPLGHASAAQLRTALDRVLTEPGFKAAAMRHSEASHRAGGYRRAADVVELTLVSAST